ncbi:hypothetical protein EYF80_023458 [Liparis tanakae]|uniref:Uncharacterized protein n=1 Tax=Liparis tanakae TaxID=230148 RepID=A0A4Z2HNJ2_9TELE|nr:hypothetical protein EYF80_023458 [Liparis tanakae]
MQQRGNLQQCMCIILEEEEEGEEGEEETIGNRLHGGSEAYPEKLEEPTHGHAHRLAHTHDGDGCFESVTPALDAKSCRHGNKASEVLGRLLAEETKEASLYTSMDGIGHDESAGSNTAARKPLSPATTRPPIISRRQTHSKVEPKAELKLSTTIKENPYGKGTRQFPVPEQAHVCRRFSSAFSSPIASPSPEVRPVMGTLVNTDTDPQRSEAAGVNHLDRTSDLIRVEEKRRLILSSGSPRMMQAL